jgi:hypothetical protein
MGNPVKTLLVSMATAFYAAAHTMVLIPWNDRAAANALAASEAFGNNGDGGEAFFQRVHPIGQPDAPDGECFTWTAASFSEAGRAALSQLAASPAWAGKIQVWDFDSKVTPGFPHAKLSELGLAVYAPPLN